MPIYCQFFFFLRCRFPVSGWAHLRGVYDFLVRSIFGTYGEADQEYALRSVTCKHRFVVSFKDLQTTTFTNSRIPNLQIYQPMVNRLKVVLFVNVLVAHFSADLVASSRG